MFLHLTPLLISSRSFTVIWCSKWLTSSQNILDFTRISKKNKTWIYASFLLVKKWWIFVLFPGTSLHQSHARLPFHGAKPCEEIWWFLPTLLWWVGRPSCFQEIPHLKMCPLELFFNQQKWGLSYGGCFRNPKQPAGMVLKPHKSWEKLSSNLPTGAGFLNHQQY